MSAEQAARRALGLLDLTSLGDDDDDTVATALCARALTPHGAVAAVCVWPRLVPACRRALAETPVRVAAVANFPEGGADLGLAVEQTRQAVRLGSDEVDVVMPYRHWLAGDRETARTLIRACRDACGEGVILKVILETGSLGSSENVGAASLDAIRSGADFIKTSTGKTDLSATPEAAQAMLRVIAETSSPVGFKASGGIRTSAEASVYLTLADRILGPDWVCADTFRFGASSLLDDLIATIEYRSGPPRSIRPEY